MGGIFESIEELFRPDAVKDVKDVVKTLKKNGFKFFFIGSLVVYTVLKRYKEIFEAWKKARKILSEGEKRHVV